MLGDFMIGDFRYEPDPAPEDVVVKLFWERGERMGQIVLPNALERSVAENDLPDLHPLPVISAIAYAMVLAAQARRNLKLSGDDAVWPVEWGTLVRAH